jgi:hypothetical protein
MSGESDIEKLLANLAPALDPEPYVFATLPPGEEVPDGIAPLATFRESEGLSLVVQAAPWRAAGHAGSADQARLTMMVHSSLEAVGMTAALAKALTEAGISANVVAAYHHDHIFVPWARRHDALAALEALTRRHR